MIEAIPLSTLNRHFALLQNSFFDRYPNAWLVWEPGRWNAPELRINPPETRWPPDETSLRVSTSDDPLCFQLPKMPAGVVTIGRASSNTLVLNDATVSRQHVNLSQDGSGVWQVEAVSDTSVAFVQDTKVPAHTRVVLPSGGRIRLGDVVLTFYEGPDFLERLVV